MVRTNPITPQQRMQLACHMIAHSGEYGMGTDLSRTYQVSRQSLYSWAASARLSLDPFTKPATLTLTASLQRAVLTLFAEAHASERGIAACLSHLGFGHLSLGRIHSIIAQAQQRALAWMQTHAPATARPLALDEIYRSRSRDAYLNVVDTASWAVWASAGPLAVDGDSWTLLLWQAQSAGLKVACFVSDGERAIAQACSLVAPECDLQRDTWHVLHRFSQIQARLVARLKKLHKQTATVERQACRLARGERPRGRTPQADPDAHNAQIDALGRAIDELAYLSGELKSLLSVVVMQAGQVLRYSRRKQEIQVVLELLGELGRRAPEQVREEFRKLHHYLELAQPGIVSFAGRLEPLEQQTEELLGRQALNLLGWAWQRRGILGAVEQLLAGLPESWQALARVQFCAWEGSVRASSAVENWHSILRPHLAAHRKLSNGHVALLAVWHNHRVFQQGKHAGMSPLQMSGMSDAPTDWLVALGYPEEPQEQPIPLTFPQSVMQGVAA
jgi:hypothetical protein